MTIAELGDETKRGLAKRIVREWMRSDSMGTAGNLLADDIHCALIRAERATAIQCARIIEEWGSDEVISKELAAVAAVIRNTWR